MSHQSQNSRKITLRDCALGIAIPITKDAFISDLGRPNEKNFARSIKERLKSDEKEPIWIWDFIYEKTAMKALRIVSEVEKLGVTVNPSLRLSDLRDLLSHFQVVTLVSHWHSPPIVPDDLLDAPLLLQRVKTSLNDKNEDRASRVARILGESLEKRFGEIPDASHYPLDALKSILAAEIQELVSLEEQRYMRDEEDTDTESFPAFKRLSDRLFRPLFSRSDKMKRGPEEEKENAHTRRNSLGVSVSNIDGSIYLTRLTRIAFEEAFPDAIAPGLCFEFADGLHSMPELIREIPEDFTKLIDFTICNSVIPGGALKRERPGGHYLMNRYPANFIHEFARYEMIIKRLNNHPGSYIDAKINPDKQEKRDENA